MPIASNPTITMTWAEFNLLHTANVAEPAADQANILVAGAAYANIDTPFKTIMRPDPDNTALVVSFTKTGAVITISLANGFRTEHNIRKMYRLVERMGRLVNLAF